jgi:hypothetical protein
MRHVHALKALVPASLAFGFTASASAALTHRYSFNDGTAGDSMVKSNCVCK